MAIIRPQIFISYSRKDADYVHQVRADLISSRVDCWIDQDSIQTGDRLNPVIKGAISGASLFFAYVTENYLASQWCMKEFEYALEAPGVTVVPFADSKATHDAIPKELMDEVVFGILSRKHSLRLRWVTRACSVRRVLGPGGSMGCRS